jgi:hypothetical protein
MASYPIILKGDCLTVTIDPAPGGQALVKLFDIARSQKPLAVASDPDPYRALGLALNALIREGYPRPTLADDWQNL